MIYSGERVQIDVKYVPLKSLTKEIKEIDGIYYQYTRQRVLWASKEHSTYASTEFLNVVEKKQNIRKMCPNR